jgi:hypothetical protein
MRAPDKAPRSTESGTESRISRIADIVKERGNLAIEEFIRALMAGFGLLEPPSNRKANSNYAQALLEWIDQGEKLLSDAPRGFNALTLFAEEERETYDAIMQKRWDAIYGMTQRADTRWNYLVELLAKLRAHCDRIVRLQLGRHGGTGYQQERAALAAALLMKRCGLPLTYSNAGSEYCRVASEFYEEMTGQSEQDIRRACERMAQFAAQWTGSAAELPRRNPPKRIFIDTENPPKR